jgi:hypothetical protein
MQRGESPLIKGDEPLKERAPLKPEIIYFQEGAEWQRQNGQRK